MGVRYKLQRVGLFFGHSRSYFFIIYKDFFLVYDKSIESIDKEKGHLPILLTAIKELFSVDDSRLILKRRERQKGLNQYQKFSEDKDYFSVQEGSAFFWVNLFDYLDTGLFLDHRPMRYKIFKMAKRYGNRPVVKN